MSTDKKKVFADEHPELYEAAQLFHDYTKRTGASDEETITLFCRMVAYHRNLLRQAQELIDDYHRHEAAGGAGRRAH